MSIKLMTLAFETPYKPSSKVYLLALCDNANDQGVCFPSLATLSQKCSMGKTNITYIAKAYESINMIDRKKRKRKNGSDASTLYTINISKLATVALSQNKERKKYLEEFENAYQKAKRKKECVHSVNSAKTVQKSCEVNTTPVHSGEHLEPSYINHQEDINISSLSKKVGFLKSKNSFINYMRGTYRNSTIGTSVDQYTNSKIEIYITGKGLLCDRISGETFQGIRAMEIWEKLYAYALADQLPILHQKKEDKQ